MPGITAWTSLLIISNSDWASDFFNFLLHAFTLPIIAHIQDLTKLYHISTLRILLSHLMIKEPAWGRVWTSCLIHLLTEEMMLCLKILVTVASSSEMCSLPHPVFGWNFPGLTFEVTVYPACDLTPIKQIPTFPSHLFILVVSLKKHCFAQYSKMLL